MACEFHSGEACCELLYSVCLYLTFTSRISHADSLILITNCTAFSETHTRKKLHISAFQDTVLSVKAANATSASLCVYNASWWYDLKQMK